MRVPCSHTALCPRSHTNPPHGTHPFARARAARSPALRALARVPTTRIRTGTPCAPCTCFPEPHAATQPDCACPSVFVGIAGLGAQLPLLYLNTHHNCQTGSIAARSGKLMIHQYTRESSDWEKKKTSVFSVCSSSVPTQTFHRKKKMEWVLQHWQEFSSQNKDRSPQIIFQGKSLVSRLSGS